MITVLSFNAPWCNPCEAMKPTVREALSGRDDVNFVSIDIDEDVEKAREYKVRSIPTLLLMKDNNEIDRLVGNHNIERVKEFINQ